MGPWKARSKRTKAYFMAHLQQRQQQPLRWRDGARQSNVEKNDVDAAAAAAGGCCCCCWWWVASFAPFGSICHWPPTHSSSGPLETVAAFSFHSFLLFVSFSASSYIFFFCSSSRMSPNWQPRTLFNMQNHFRQHSDASQLMVLGVCERAWGIAKGCQISMKCA